MQLKNKIHPTFGVKSCYWRYVIYPDGVSFQMSDKLKFELVDNSDKYDSDR